jgi:hypothetical protein
MVLNSVRSKVITVRDFVLRCAVLVLNSVRSKVITIMLQ